MDHEDWDEVFLFWLGDFDDILQVSRPISRHPFWISSSFSPLGWVTRTVGWSSSRSTPSSRCVSKRTNGTRSSSSTNSGSICRSGGKSENTVAVEIISGLPGQQRATIDGDLAEHRGPPPHPHGLAQRTQEQGRLLCQEGEEADSRGRGDLGWSQEFITLTTFPELRPLWVPCVRWYLPQCSGPLLRLGGGGTD